MDREYTLSMVPSIEIDKVYFIYGQNDGRTDGRTRVRKTQLSAAEEKQN